MQKISAIVPVYNEAECIEKTFAAVLEYLDKRPYYSFLFVNDGSTDKTKEIIESKINGLSSSRINLISYDNRQGKGYAVNKGVQYADGDYICFIDSDLAYSLDHLDMVVEKLEYFDVVIGCRHLTSDKVVGVKFSRMIAGKVFNILSNQILDLKFSDMQAGVKGFSRIAAKELFNRQDLTGFSFDAELLYLAKKLGFSIGEIPAKVSESHQYKFSKINLLKDSVKMFMDLLAIRINDLRGRYE